MYKRLKLKSKSTTSTLTRHYPAKTTLNKFEKAKSLSQNDEIDKDEELYNKPSEAPGQTTKGMTAPNTKGVNSINMVNIKRNNSEEILYGEGSGDMEKDTEDDSHSDIYSEPTEKDIYITTGHVTNT